MSKTLSRPSRQVNQAKKIRAPKGKPDLGTIYLLKTRRLRLVSALIMVQI